MVVEKVNGRVIGIVSGKGGVGKTVTAINLALALRSFGEEVTIVDTDISASNLGLQLGLYSFPTTLQDVLRKRAKIHHALYPMHMGIKLVPCSISLGDMKIKPRRLKEVLKKLKKMGGTILVDSPPGLDKDALTILDACDEVIIVVTPELPSMTNAIKVIKTAKEMKKQILGIVINRHKNDKYDIRPEEIEIVCEAPIIGKIPEDSAIRKSIFEKTPLLLYSPYSKATLSFHALAAKILEREYKVPRFPIMRRLLERLGLLGGMKSYE